MTPLRIEEISVQALAPLIQDKIEGVQLVDVREPQELAIASLPGFQNFPLSQHETWSATLVQQLDLHKETWVLCHHGVRSAQMCGWLMGQGFTSVKNIAGGIDAYALRVDQSVPRY